MQKILLPLLSGMLWVTSLTGTEIFRNTGLTDAVALSDAQKQDFAAAKLKFTGDKFPAYYHLFRHRLTAPGEVSYQSGAVRINAPAGVRLEYVRIARRALKKGVKITLDCSGKGEVELRLRQFNLAGKFIKTTSGGIEKCLPGQKSIMFYLDPESLDRSAASVGIFFVVTGDIDFNRISGIASENSAVPEPQSAPASVPQVKAAEKLTINSDFADCLQADEAMKSALAKRKVVLKSALFPEKWTLVPHGGAGTVEFAPGEPGILKISCSAGVRLMAVPYRIRSSRLQPGGYLAEVAASGSGKVESRLICLNKSGKFIRTIRAAEAMEFNGSNQLRQTLIPAAELPADAYAVIPLFILTGNLEITSVSGSSVK